MNFMGGRIDAGAVVIEGGVRLPIPPSVADAISSRSGSEVRMGIRPEDLHPSSDAAAHAVRVVAAVSLREPLGHETLTHLRFGSVEWVARGTREFSPGPDGQTPVFLDLDRMHIFWKDSGRRVDAADATAGATEAPA